ncbi:MAG: hypothetical protein JWP12_1152 [Bacteroidetes bacterium]|nr:hypothetical protein [Bacteroidota bacterium]
MYYSSGLDSAFLAVFVIIAFIVFIIGLVLVILYLLTLQRTLEAVSPENQKMPPGQVWMVFIPLFGIVWQFIMVNRIADSLKAEFQKRNIQADEDRPGAGIGIAYCVLGCCCVIPLLNFLAIIGYFVCWIIYWVKIAGYKRKLEQTRPAQTTGF